MSEGARNKTRWRGRLSVSRLTLTIVLANLVGLVILLLGSLGVTAFRESLVEAKLEGVRAQAQIFADILAQTAVDAEACEPIEQAVTPGVGIGQSDPVAICNRVLQEENVVFVFNRVWDSFEGRIRVYRTPPGGETVVDAQDLLIDDVVLRQDKIRPVALGPIEGVTADSAVWRLMALSRETLGAFLTSGYREAAAARSIEEELTLAIQSQPFADVRGWSWVRLNEDGELVASVSIPIRKVQAVYGVVTSEIGGIEDLVTKSQAAILPFFGLAVAAAILSSLLLTAAIAQPIRQLAIAADKVREGISAAGRARIPDFTHRRDEIGELSASLKAMTQAIYNRIEAIESFAADVAHELKNPLTSVRSASETMEIAKKPEAREKLMNIIKKDVERMDRLITDISNASRLDAELAREARTAVDLRKLVTDIVDLYTATQKEGQAPVAFDPSGAPVYLFGNAGALGQVIRNLIDNARSFSPEDGQVIVIIDPGTDRDRTGRIFVEDDGPGIPPDSLERIFERFYTKRPSGATFGNNSGLGLAICRQIITAHGGRIWAENRLDQSGPDAVVKGARFIVELPLAG